MSIAKPALLAGLLMAGTAAVVPDAAWAGGGGGSAGGANACPWIQDVTLDLGGHDIVVPQSVFDPKAPHSDVGGFQLVPALDQLVLRIFGPNGERWEAALTLISGGKRCTAFYVGRPFLVAGPTEDPPPRQARSRQSGH